MKKFSEVLKFVLLENEKLWRLVGIFLYVILISRRVSSEACTFEWEMVKEGELRDDYIRRNLVGEYFQL